MEDRLYNIIAITEKTGNETLLNMSPMCHKEACIMLSKFIERPGTRFILKEDVQSIKAFEVYPAYFEYNIRGWGKLPSGDYGWTSLTKKRKGTVVKNNAMQMCQRLKRQTGIVSAIISSNTHCTIEKGTFKADILLSFVGIPSGVYEVGTVINFQ